MGEPKSNYDLYNILEANHRRQTTKDILLLNQVPSFGPKKKLSSFISVGNLALTRRNHGEPHELSLNNYADMGLLNWRG